MQQSRKQVKDQPSKPGNNDDAATRKKLIAMYFKLNNGIKQHEAVSLKLPNRGR
jgi:hypothetical protein